MYGGVTDHHAALSHHLFQVAQAQAIGRVPANAHQHDLKRIVQPLEHRTKDGRFELDAHGYRRPYRSDFGTLRQNRWRCRSIDLVECCDSICREPGMPISEPPTSRTVVADRGSRRAMCFPSRKMTMLGEWSSEKAFSVGPKESPVCLDVVRDVVSAPPCGVAADANRCEGLRGAAAGDVRAAGRQGRARTPSTPHRGQWHMRARHAPTLRRATAASGRSNRRRSRDARRDPASLAARCQRILAREPPERFRATQHDAAADESHSRSSSLRDRASLRRANRSDEQQDMASMLAAARVDRNTGRAGCNLS